MEITLTWIVGVSLGLIAPWIFRRGALRHAFAINGITEGLLLWAMMSVVTVPVATVLSVGFGEIFGG
jgi:hypothetical protein